jgi:hypothetical protein
MRNFSALSECSVAKLTGWIGQEGTLADLETPFPAVLRAARQKTMALALAAAKWTEFAALAPDQAPEEVPVAVEVTVIVAWPTELLSALALRPAAIIKTANTHTDPPQPTRTPPLMSNRNPLMRPPTANSPLHRLLHPATQLAPTTPPIKRAAGSSERRSTPAVDPRFPAMNP